MGYSQENVGMCGKRRGEKLPRAFLFAGITGVALSLGIMGLIAYGTYQELK